LTWEYLKSKHFSHAFLWRGRITLRLKMESSRTFRHRISLSRISESTPAVVQENGLAVRKRLGLLSKAIAVSSLFSGMIPTCSQRAQWTKYNMKPGKRLVFSFHYGARTIPIPDTTANRAFPIHRRIILPLSWCSRIKIFPTDMIFLHWRQKLPYFHSNLTAKTCQTHVSYSHFVYT